MCNSVHVGPESIKELQRGWIGPGEGHMVDFCVQGESGALTTVTCFTTRVETLMGVAFVAVSPHHSLLEVSWVNIRGCP